jgi:pantoate--beta-alanine ligase
MTEVARTRTELRAGIARWRRDSLNVALVPTMGALHGGHLSLIALARARAGAVVASLFVNPAQFAADEDLASYPRDEAQDRALLERAGCDLIYAPSVAEIYPPGFSTVIAVPSLGAFMEGAVRPHHFAGVATVVAKLLIQVMPDVAVFGEKDYQQLAIIRRLVRDFDLPVEILGGPIVREADGLALSSRNVYLSPGQREIAPALHRCLVAAARALAAGHATEEVEPSGFDELKTAGFDGVDYIEVRAPETLERLGPGPVLGPARVLAAARLGKTRLIDNVVVQRSTPSQTRRPLSNGALELRHAGAGEPGAEVLGEGGVGEEVEAFGSMDE